MEFDGKAVKESANCNQISRGEICVANFIPPYEWCLSVYLFPAKNGISPMLYRQFDNGVHKWELVCNPLSCIYFRN